METLNTLISFGNKKLPKTTAIFNMGTAMDCPSDKLGLCVCSKICYAKKAEKMYPACKPYRMRQAEYWKNCTADQFVVDFLQAIARKRTKPNMIRLNESGDFYNQDCVNKAEEIARQLNLMQIKVYGYTARKDLNFESCKHLIVNGSSFTKAGINNIFLPVPKFTGNKNNLRCLGDCKKCTICSTKLNKTIEVQIH